MRADSKKFISLGGIFVLTTIVFTLLFPIVLARHASAQEITGDIPSEQARALENETNSAIAASQTSKPPSKITPVECTITEITCGILVALNWLVDMVIFIVYPLVESLFDTMLVANFTAFSGPDSSFLIATQVGWRIVLGVVNAFFALFLLWIAIATIFDFQMFSARSLLPKLIIAALLINFSLVIGKSIITLSNGIGQIFSAQIQRQGGVAEAVSRIFDPRTLTMAVQNNYTSLNKEEARQKLRNTTTTVEMGFTILWFLPISTGVNGTWTAEQCYEEVYGGPTGGWASFLAQWGSSIRTRQYIQCRSLLADVSIQQALVAFDPKYGKDILLAGAFIAKALMVPLVLFVLAAASIMFLVRLVSLMGLLIFAPLAFFSLIISIPGAGNLWSEWWSKLFKWSFFLPAFLFLFMLSILVVRGIAPATQQAIFAGQAVPNLSILLTEYFIGIGLMVMALLVGNQMSIYGASAVVGVGKKMQGAAGKWAKGTGKIFGGRAVGAALGSGAGQWMAAGRYRRHLLRPLEAATAVGRKVEGEREKAALKRRSLAAKVSPEMRQSIMAGMAPSERADFVRDMKDHELRAIMGVMSPQQRINLHQEMKKHELDDKILNATQDLTTVVELETGVERSQPQFQEAFNSWLKGATVGDLQKRISADDIRKNANLQQALATKGVGELSDLKTIAHTRDKAEALRQHFIDLGNRSTFDGELSIGFSEVEASERAIGRATGELAKTNQQLANDITGALPIQINLARSRPLGKKTGPPVVVVQQAAPAAPTP